MRSLMSRRCGLPWAFSRRDSLLVEIIWSRSSATSLSDLRDLVLSFFNAAVMARRGPSRPVILEPVILALSSVTKAGCPVSARCRRHDHLCLVWLDATKAKWPSHWPTGFRSWSLRVTSHGSLFGNPMVQQYSAQGRQEPATPGRSTHPACAGGAPYPQRKTDNTVSVGPYQYGNPNCMRVAAWVPRSGISVALDGSTPTALQGSSGSAPGRRTTHERPTPARRTETGRSATADNGPASRPRGGTRRPDHAHRVWGTGGHGQLRGWSTDCRGPAHHRPPS